MKIFNGIEVFSNGSIKAPCGLFSMRNDIETSLHTFYQTSVNVVLITIWTFVFCTYKYFRNVLQWEMATHQAELFRHNWFAHQTTIERNLGIVNENRQQDSSSNCSNIYPKANNKKSKDDDVVRRKKLGADDNNIDRIGLLPRDKLAVFSNVIAMRIEVYIAMIVVTVFWLASIAFIISVRLSLISSESVFHKRSFYIDRTLSVVNTHLDVYENRHESHRTLTYCYGDYAKLMESLSSSTLTAVKIFTSETELSHAIMMVIEDVLILGLFIEIAVNCFYPLIKYPSNRARNKRKVFMYGASFKFMQLFFLGFICISGCLVFNQRLRE